MAAAKAVLMNKTFTIASPTVSRALLSPRSAIVRPASDSIRSIVTMNKDGDRQHLDAIFEQKRSLRAKVRKTLKNMDPIQKSYEDNAIQNIVLEAPWFRSSNTICAYISSAALREVDTSRVLSEILCNSAKEGNMRTGKKLYVPRVEDRNSNMRMLKVSSLNDLIENSMNILEPAPIDCDGNQCEDVMQVGDPVDLFILPGLAFDTSGRRLGRGGGYYDMFLMKYKELVKERKWKQPLLVALCYSVQIMEEGVIPVTTIDVPVDALVSPAGSIHISPAALHWSN